MIRSSLLTMIKSNASENFEKPLGLNECHSRCLINSFKSSPHTPHLHPTSYKKVGFNAYLNSINECRRLKPLLNYLNITFNPTLTEIKII